MSVDAAIARASSEPAHPVAPARQTVIGVALTDLAVCLEDVRHRKALRTDNGTPFATTGAGQLSQLAVWWVKLGIQLDRIDPGHPEQNGRHERFHLTLQTETTSPPARSPAQQQRRFDRQRQAVNEVRPHEALGQTPPARTYQGSPRPYPGRLEDPWYDATNQVRRVSPNGQIKWRGELVFVSEAVCGELVGLAETARGDWTVRFMH